MDGRSIHIQTRPQSRSLGAAPRHLTEPWLGPAHGDPRLAAPPKLPLPPSRRQHCLMISSPSCRLPARLGPHSKGSGGSRRAPRRPGRPLPQHCPTQPTSQRRDPRASRPVSRLRSVLAASRAAGAQGLPTARGAQRCGPAEPASGYSAVCRPLVVSSCARLFPGVPPHQCVPRNMLLLPLISDRNQ